MLPETEFLVWSNIGSTIIGALVGGLVSHLLTRHHESARESAARKRHLAALEAEINYCAKLAATYAQATFQAPLYRFPQTVYDTVYPSLLSEILTEADVTALTSFYSQVQQMNRGLDAIEGYRAAREHNLLQKEFARLVAKAREMSHPDGTLVTPAGGHDFFSPAIAAINRHLAN